MSNLKIENPNKKFIICCGCSYTNTFIKNPPITQIEEKQKWYWTDWLQVYLGNEYCVLNVGNQTNDNASIVNILLHTISELEIQGVNTQNIQLIVQWTNPYRMSFYVETDNPKSGVHTLNFIDKDDNGFWYLTGGFRNFETLNDIIPTKFLETYVAFYNNKVNCYNRFFKDVLLLQNLCKVKDIKWTSFFMNESLTQNYYKFDSVYDRVNKKVTYGIDLLIEKNIQPNIDKPTIWQENKNIEYLFNMIDLNNFYFFETPQSKYGGLYEWCIANYDRNILNSYKEDNTPIGLFIETTNNTDLSFEDEIKMVNNNKHRYGHPTSIMAKMFVDKVLLNLVN